MADHYAVKELFVTIQGEGMRAGTKAVFLRFAGCNLWNGLPAGRAAGKGACARWCDTDFAKGMRVEIGELLDAMDRQWDWSVHEKRWVVITGGEPFLQLDAQLLDALHARDWKVAVETNGTLDGEGFASLIDWVCVSPKKGGELALRRAHELKVVLPGAVDGEEGWTEEELVAFEAMGFDDLIVQPQDPVHVGAVGDTYLHPLSPHPYLARAYAEHLRQCVEWVMNHPSWRLGGQAHKVWRLP